MARILLPQQRHQHALDGLHQHDRDDSDRLVFRLADSRLHDGKRLAEDRVCFAEMVALVRHFPDMGKAEAAAPAGWRANEGTESAGTLPTWAAQEAKEAGVCAATSCALALQLTGGASFCAVRVKLPCYTFFELEEL